MKKELLLTEKEMQQIDKNTIERTGISAPVLMERAALCVAEYVDNMHKETPHKKLLVVAGNGNNGADGIACARILQELGKEVCAYVIPEKEKRHPVLQKQIELAQAFGVTFCQELPVDENTILIDAIFGIGLNRNITGEIANIIDRINNSNAKIVSVDIPSGIHAGTGQVMGCAIKADATITFGFCKLGQALYPGKSYCGTVICKKMGINEISFFETLPKYFSYDKDVGNDKIELNRAADGNKGTFGKILVVAGNNDTPGAAMLCCKAAFYSGCGMVSLYTSKKVAETVICGLPETMLHNKETDKDRKILEEQLKWCDVIAMGPGMGTTEEEKEILEYVIKHSKKPVVLDADAIRILSENKELAICLQNMQKDEKTRRLLLMTPHMGELAALSDCEISELKENKITYVKECAKTYHMILVCKDADTFVKGMDEMMYVNTVGCNGMATAGSGDVLTGICASVVAQYIKKQEIPYERFLNSRQSDMMSKAFYGACMSVFLHGYAGKKAAVSYGNAGITASDLLQTVKGLIK